METQVQEVTPATPKIATRQSILAFKGKPLKPLDIPEWGGTVYIRTMSGTQRDAFESTMYKIKGKNVEMNRANARARLVVLCLCDETGTLLFEESEAALLGAQPADLLNKAYTVAMRANGFTEEDVEELTKNS